ncbi:hypothetical protein C8Q79DRAFT_251922 [Trametes meyenii]|nr:hypothetical protein C8Q79DRAFT_251922 [Trametes meyenii]
MSCTINPPKAKARVTARGTQARSPKTSCRPGSAPACHRGCRRDHPAVLPAHREPGMCVTSSSAASRDGAAENPRSSPSPAGWPPRIAKGKRKTASRQPVPCGGALDVCGMGRLPCRGVHLAHPAGAELAFISIISLHLGDGSARARELSTPTVYRRTRARDRAGIRRVPQSPGGVHHVWGEGWHRRTSNTGHRRKDARTRRDRRPRERGGGVS